MKSILFIGDSITDINLYPAMIETILKLKNITSFTITNVGLSSETVCGLTEDGHPFPRPNINNRIKAVLDTTKPDIVFCFYGINDGIYKLFDNERFSLFKQGYQQLLNTLQSYKTEINLLTPMYFDNQSCKSVCETDGKVGLLYKYYDEVMEIYSHFIKTELPPQVNSIIDIHNEVKAFINSKTNYISGDGIHPNFEVTFLIASIILRDYFKISLNVSFCENKHFLKCLKLVRKYSTPEHYVLKENIGHSSPYKSKIHKSYLFFINKNRILKKISKITKSYEAKNKTY